MAWRNRYSLTPNIYDPHDAIYTTAAYLCDDWCDDGAGNPATLTRAIYQYNHSSEYVAAVLAQARRYFETTSNRSVGCASFQSTVQGAGRDFSSSALAAVRFACAQLGKPYVWDGNGEPGSTPGNVQVASHAKSELDRSTQIRNQARTLSARYWIILVANE